MVEELSADKIREVLTDSESMRMIEQFKHLRLKRYDLLREMDFIKVEESQLESDLCRKHNLSLMQSLSLMLHVDIEDMKRLKR